MKRTPASWLACIRPPGRVGPVRQPSLADRNEQPRSSARHRSAFGGVSRCTDRSSPIRTVRPNHLPRIRTERRLHWTTARYHVPPTR